MHALHTNTQQAPRLCTVAESIWEGSQMAAGRAGDHSLGTKRSVSSHSRGISLVELKGPQSPTRSLCNRLLLHIAKLGETGHQDHPSHIMAPKQTKANRHDVHRPTHLNSVSQGLGEWCMKLRTAGTEHSLKDKYYLCMGVRSRNGRPSRQPSRGSDTKHSTTHQCCPKL